MFNSGSEMPFTMNVEPAGCNNGGFGDGYGGGWFWVILIILLCGGWGGYGNGFFGGAGSTASGITDGYILTSDFANIERKIDGVNNGICSLGYDQLAQMNNINQNVSAQGAAMQNAITQQTIADMGNVNAITAQITALANQEANCCCENRYERAQAFADLNYNLATQSCQTRQAIADNTRAVLDAIQAQTVAAKDEKIAEQANQIFALQLAASQQAQNNYLVNTLTAQIAPRPIPAFSVPAPYQYTGCCQSNYGCGC